MRDSGHISDATIAVPTTLVRTVGVFYDRASQSGVIAVRDEHDGRWIRVLRHVSLQVAEVTGLLLALRTIPVGARATVSAVDTHSTPALTSQLRRNEPEDEAARLAYAKLRADVHTELARRDVTVIPTRARTTRQTGARQSERVSRPASASVLLAAAFALIGTVPLTADAASSPMEVLQK